MLSVLIAEDDPVSRRVLEASLVKQGYDVVVATDGLEAWEILQREDHPELAILDWMMPGLDGVDVCRKLRALEDSGSYVYIILLTAKDRKEDVAAGLDAGADDYISKPFDARELYARVEVGIRIITLQNKLHDHVEKLEDALSRVKLLQGLLPICAYCKKIRSDENYWQQVESYIVQHSEAKFSHSICPECYSKYVKPELDQLSFDIGPANEHVLRYAASDAMREAQCIDKATKDIPQLCDCEHLKNHK